MLYQLHRVGCLVTGPYPLPKQPLQRVWSSASSFIFQYLLFSLVSSSRCLHLPPLLIIPYIFPSILCKIWPNQLAFLCFIVFRMFHSSLILHNISFFTWSVHLLHPSLAPHFKTFKVFLIYSPKCSSFSSIQS